MWAYYWACKCPYTYLFDCIIMPYQVAMRNASDEVYIQNIKCLYKIFFINILKNNLKEIIFSHAQRII